MINLDVTFIIQTVNFLVLLFVLNVFLYKPLRKVLADRNAELAGAKEKTLAVDREVQARMAEYEARLREVKAAAGDDRGRLKKEAQEEEAGIVEAARKEASDTLKVITNKVAKEASDARELLHRQAEELSAEICQKVIGRSI